MQILLFGKYPPIQGGECTKLYWLARGLAARGHSITVLSNCQEVESQYRCTINESDSDEWIPPSVSLVSTLWLDPPLFIPSYNPHSEKLVSRGLEVIEEIKPDVLLGWYLLPYGVAAHIAARMTSVKYCVQHAGSDVSRLLPNPYLHSLLKRVLTDADLAFVYPKLLPYFESLGCRRTFSHTPVVPPVFNPAGPAIDWQREFGIGVDPDRAFLFLGKVARGKGIHYLIDAFRRTPDDCSLIILGDGPFRATCERYIAEKRIGSVHFVGPVAPWKVPAVIRGVRAVVVPEHDFGVGIHESRIPYEATLCGVTTIVSDEIFRKYAALEAFIKPVNPVDADSFGAVLTSALAPELNHRTAGRHDQIRESLGDFDSYLRSVEEALGSLAA